MEGPYRNFLFDLEIALDAQDQEEKDRNWQAETK